MHSLQSLLCAALCLCYAWAFGYVQCTTLSHVLAAKDFSFRLCFTKCVKLYIHVYIWHLLICVVYRNHVGRTCTQHLIFDIALVASLLLLLGRCLPSAARHAWSEATRFVTANRTQHRLTPAHNTDRRLQITQTKSRTHHRLRLAHNTY